jgi:hypothetical protein
VGGEVGGGSVVVVVVVVVAVLVVVVDCTSAVGGGSSPGVALDLRRLRRAQHQPGANIVKLAKALDVDPGKLMSRIST